MFKILLLAWWTCSGIKHLVCMYACIWIAGKWCEKRGPCAEDGGERTVGPGRPGDGLMERCVMADGGDEPSERARHRPHRPSNSDKMLHGKAHVPGCDIGSFYHCTLTKLLRAYRHNL